MSLTYEFQRHIITSGHWGIGKMHYLKSSLSPNTKNYKKNIRNILRYLRILKTQMKQQHLDVFSLFCFNFYSSQNMREIIT